MSGICFETTLGWEESTQVQVAQGWQLLETGDSQVGLHRTSLYFCIYFKFSTRES